jgi:hypothetical protein
MATSLFDRVAGIVEEIGAEKRAAYTEKRAGSKDMGNSTHPTEKATDDDEQDPVEGAHSKDNERIIRETVPNNVVETPDATEGNAPKYEDVSLSQGVETGPTGTGAETPPIDKPINDKKEGDQGGTTHPADANYKMSSEQVAVFTPRQILKTAAELGNDVLADLANGIYGEAPVTQKRAGDANAAATAGQKTAAAAGQLTNDLDVLAADIVGDIVKSAYHQADLVARSIQSNLRNLSKHAGGEDGDPTGGAGDGEAHGSEAAGGGDGDGDADDGGGDAQGLMSAMGGPGGDPGAGGGAPPPGGGGDGGMDPQMLQQLIQALQQDPQLAAQLEQILAGAGGGAGGPPPGGDPSGGGMPPPGGDPSGGGMPPPGGDPSGGAGGPPPGGPMPPEMAAMGDKQAMQQLGMALVEANINPNDLAKVNPWQGAKIASAVRDFQRSGQFEFSEAKKGSAERKVRDYMKGYVRELYSRSRR